MHILLLTVQVLKLEYGSRQEKVTVFLGPQDTSLPAKCYTKISYISQSECE